MYKSSDLRYKTKQMLDEAHTGKAVQIRRGIQEFVLRRNDKDSAILAVLARLEVLESFMNNYLNDNNPQLPSPGELIPFNGTPDNPEFTESRAGEKPCCQNGKPCPHWSWDGTDEAWINSLSGRRKDG